MKHLKIAVLSDSHDNTDNLEKVCAIANQHDCSYLLHLGDITTPHTAQYLGGFNGIVKAVFGNCDSDVPGLQQVFNTMGGDIQQAPAKVDLEGKQIVMMHEPYQLDQLIQAQNADFIFYGHLHKVDVRNIGKTLVMNPGDAGGWVRKANFFIIDLVSNQYEKFNL